MAELYPLGPVILSPSFLVVARDLWPRLHRIDRHRAALLLSIGMEDGDDRGRSKRGGSAYREKLALRPIY